ncbi:hypothetical protein Vretimale_19502 [Volvox reticuliferus]|uniref:Uncharacterized protein n=1 Tax=Volvox reticuliferus TaxID=1737510 RepID=A0A8J4C6I5_9CHLO|nr:hypothetical protein Vretifemale_6081 [Volvox reticuliferus]GIM16939.1 hypothetical protein Vretimale_19502 [Volvox reticuliferus]
MPRQRQRIVFCDCYDCRDRPNVLLNREQLDASNVVARQEPPPKALLLFATGLVVSADGETNLDSCTLPHLNLVVREGNLGLLAVRHADGLGPGPAVSELAQLLGVYQDVLKPHPSQDCGDVSLPSLATRFKGMQAAFASTNASARQLAQQLGMALVDRLNLGAAGCTPSGEADPSAGDATAGGAATTAQTVGGAADGSRGKNPLGLPDAASFAATISAELGAAEGSIGRDLLLLHMDLDDLMGHSSPLKEAADEEEAQATARATTRKAGVAAVTDADARWDAGLEALEWLDSLVKGLLMLPEIRESTLLMLMLSPAGHEMPAILSMNRVGANSSLLQPGGMQLDPSAVIVTLRNLAQLGRSGGETVAAAAATAGACGALAVLGMPDLPLVTRPVQSFELLGLAHVETDARAPVLIARRLPGVVRRDRAERLGYREALTAGSMGAIMMDRLLPDVAYKIGRAPKYGA